MSVQSNMAASGHMWLFGFRIVAGVTEEMNFELTWIELKWTYIHIEIAVCGY